MHRIIFGIVVAGLAWGQPAKQWTLQELFQRNIGSREMQDTAFPPHKIAGNLYYVGTQSLGSFLITTPEGHILINSDYERNVPTIRGSVEKLGFKFTDIKVVLGSHAHADHTKGCTSWEFKVAEDGKNYDVVVIGSLGVNPGFKLVNNAQNPTIAEEYKQAFKVLRSLHVDIPLGSHPAMYNLDAKYPKIGKGPNPFVDPAGYKAELDIVEDVFNRTLAEQSQATASPK